MSRAARDCPRYVGCCEVFDEIAKGGYATVYLGRWLGVGGFTRAVAIKRLHRQFVSSSKVVTMFANEARIVARIKHPHVLSTIDLVSHDDELFIIMDYIEGLTVSNLLLLAHRNQQEIPAAVERMIDDRHHSELEDLLLKLYEQKAVQLKEEILTLMEEKAARQHMLRQQ